MFYGFCVYVQVASKQAMHSSDADAPNLYRNSSHPHTSYHNRGVIVTVALVINDAVSTQFKHSYCWCASISSVLIVLDAIEATVA